MWHDATHRTCYLMLSLRAVQMFLFLAAACGWGTTRQHLSLTTQRAHIAVAFAFYVCLVVLSRFAALRYLFR